MPSQVATKKTKQKKQFTNKDTEQASQEKRIDFCFVFYSYVPIIFLKIIYF